MRMEEISRVGRSKVAARASYNRMSRWYDWIASSEKKFAEMGLLLLAPRSGEKILEIGCGTGRIMVDLARTISPSGNVTGVDISEGMLHSTQERLVKSGVHNYDLYLGDAAHLSLSNHHFDAVFMCFTLELFDTPEIPIVLDECLRVLKPGGKICVIALVKQERWAVRIYEWFHMKLPETIDCRPIFAEASIDAAGFNILQVEQKAMWGLPVEIVVAEK